MPEQDPLAAALPVTADLLRKADSAYKPFPSFREWMGSMVDIRRWESYAAKLNRKGSLSKEHLKRAQEVAKRAAAVDTGAIEGLYEVDRGFTFTVATEAATWEATLAEKGPEVKALIGAQLAAYDSVIDLATKAVPIAEAWIRELHAEICRAQATYTVYTEIGIQEQPLPHGEYKHHPNHVLLKDGLVHSYAPVDLTPAEMHRLSEEIRSDDFVSAHPVLQASYAHYALVAIHPFADGNGRVARALASVFTYRAQSIPLLVLVDNRREYYEALRDADKGRYQTFVDFVLNRSLDAMQLVEASLSASAYPLASDALQDFQRLYITSAGYTHAEVDQAGYKLIEAMHREVEAQAAKHSLKDHLTIQAGMATSIGHTPVDPKYRLSVTQGARALTFTLSSTPPAQAMVQRVFVLEVPKDYGKEDDIVIRDITTATTFEARVVEITPALTSSLQIRLRIFVQGVFGRALQDLKEKAAQALRGRGF